MGDHCRWLLLAWRTGGPWEGDLMVPMALPLTCPFALHREREQRGGELCAEAGDFD